MFRVIERNSRYQIYSIDMAGIHPDQEPEDYFGVQLGILMKEKMDEGLFLRTITPVYSRWVVTFTSLK